MKMSTAVAAAAIALVLASGSASAAVADVGNTDETATTAAPPTEWYAVLPDSGSVFVPGETDIWESQPTSGGEISPMLLAFDDWAACWTFHNETWVIESHPFWWDGVEKNMTLQCGKEQNPGGQGFHHIRFGHELEWRDRITQVGVQGASTDPWDDLMWWSARMALDVPTDSSGPVNGKLCVSTQVDMYRTDNNQYVYSFYPTFSWSLTNDRLITGYPSSVSNC